MLKFTMIISDDLKDKLDTEASKLEVPRMTLVRMILNNYFNSSTNEN